MKNPKIFRYIIPFIAMVCIAVFVYSGYQIFSYYKAEKDVAELTDSLIRQAVDIISEKTETSSSEASEERLPITVDFETLLQQNGDIVGWIYCADTPINYPIVQSEDNDYYLHRLLNGKYNVNGSIFLDYRNHSQFADFNSVVYGHNMKTGEMFGSLVKYKEQSYYDAHPILYLLTPSQSYKVELYAGYITASDADVYALEHTENNSEAFLRYAAEHSTFRSDIAVTQNDKFITLSTCSYEYENARYVVIGRLVETE